jgi:hypothetical protein
VERDSVEALQQRNGVLRDRLLLLAEFKRDALVELARSQAERNTMSEKTQLLQRQLKSACAPTSSPSSDDKGCESLRQESLRQGLARGDRNCSLNEGQIPNSRGVRVHVSTGYNRVGGNRRASDPTEVPTLRFVSRPSVPSLRPTRAFLWVRRRVQAGGQARPARAGRHGRGRLLRHPAPQRRDPLAPQALLRAASDDEHGARSRGGKRCGQRSAELIHPVDPSRGWTGARTRRLP